LRVADPPPPELELALLEPPDDGAGALELLLLLLDPHAAIAMEPTRSAATALIRLVGTVFSLFTRSWPSVGVSGAEGVIRL
jgi:hypothetical protein